MRRRDEPAYPTAGIQDSDESRPVGGLTKLEYTAIQAMQGRCVTVNVTVEELAVLALRIANALWDELEKEK